MNAALADLMPGACLIDGAWTVGDFWLEVDDPATGRVVGRVPSLGADAAQAAVAAAERAWPIWRARTAQDRADVLMRLHRLMLERRADLAALLTAEQGKPLAEAESEIGYAASFVQWFAEEGKRAYGEVVPAYDTTKRTVVLRQPVGVVAAITPWNFPAAMVTRKIAPALAAGCTIVLKPDERTPLTALAIGVLAVQAGVPAGVLNIVTGDPRPIGQMFCESAAVRKLSFTGSTAIGSLLFAQCAPSIKRLSLELGGNAPFIVFDDADLESAVIGAVAAKFRNAGQTCICANRFFVQAGIHDRFVAAFGRAVAGLTVGPGDSGATIGPLIDEKAVVKVEAHVADAIVKGAQVEAGGRRHSLGGRYFQPTVLTGVNAAMLVTSEETFGPVASIARFADEAELIAAANNVPYGLAAYFYTSDAARVWRVAEAIEAGMIGINTGLISSETVPFGGIKASGLGREGAREGLEGFLETKYLCLAI